VQHAESIRQDVFGIFDIQRVILITREEKEVLWIRENLSCQHSIGFAYRKY